MIKEKLKITDDSGFLAVVNRETYHSFVSEDWELEQLMNHLLEEMNQNTIIFWETGTENEWPILFTNKSSSNKSFREFSKTINVTAEKLYLTNYEDLTMAAQFKDVKIPAEHNSDLVIELNNGLYNLTIRQMFDFENYDPEEGEGFEIIIESTDKPSEKINKIYWTK